MTRALLAMALLSAAGVVRADGFAPPSVTPVDETAVLIWDEPGGVEHLTRTVAYADGPGVALVPTPARPVVVATAHFPGDLLAQLTAPRVVRRPRLVPLQGDQPVFRMERPSDWNTAESLGNTARRKSPGNATGTPMPAAEVVGWLREKGYDPDRPALRDWLANYPGDWHLTAFPVSMHVIEAAQAARGGWIRPMRLSFPTAVPILPYREPAGPAPDWFQRHHLRLFVLAPTRVEPLAGIDPGAPVAADIRTVWAGQLRRSDVTAVARACGLSPYDDAAIADRVWWLTEFADHRLVRPNYDLGFRPAADPSPLERPPIIQEVPVRWPVWGGGVLLLLTAVVILQLVRHRTRPGNTP